MTIDRYFREKIVSCRRCASNPDLQPFMTYEQLTPFVGSQSRHILLIGHSPRVRTSSKISITLDLTENRRLRNYVENEVLHPLGIGLQWCSATNVVKCLTRKMPENMTISGIPFMHEAFKICKVHLIQEIGIVQPKLVISFSERVSTLLQESFGSAKRIRRMKEIFATLQELKVGNKVVAWIPVVHIPKPKVRACYFPEQTERLVALRSRVAEVLC